MSKPTTKKGAREILKGGDGKRTTRVSAKASAMVAKVAEDKGKIIAIEIADASRAIAHNSGRKTVMEKDVRVALDFKCYPKH